MRNTLWATLMLAAVVAGALAIGSTQARSLAQNIEAPQLVFQSPADSAILNEPAFFIQICFADPINVRDLHEGGDFAFTVTGPDGLGLGFRAVFQPDGYGAAIYPGPPPGETTGEWTFTWRVTSPDGEQASDGETNYTVDPDGDPTPQSTPPACIGEQGTATPTRDEAPAATSTGPEGNEDASSTPGLGEEPEGEADESDSDLLLIALIASGSVVVLLIVGFTISRARRRSASPPSGEPSDDL